MARQLAPSLRRVAFASVFTSPSLRARQTCELAGLAPASEISPDLQEWDYGDYEGQLSKDIRKRRPDWDVWRTDAQRENRQSKFLIAPTGCSKDCSARGQYSALLAWQFAACWLRDGSDCRPLRGGISRYIRRASAFSDTKAITRKDGSYRSGTPRLYLWSGRARRPTGEPSNVRPRRRSMECAVWWTQTPGHSLRIGRGRDGGVPDRQLQPGSFRGPEGPLARGFSERSTVERKGDRRHCAVPERSDLFFVAEDASKVVGSIMVGFDGHQGWLYAVAVLNSHRRQGIGSALVQEAEARLASMGCVKCGLQVGLSNADVVDFMGPSAMPSRNASAWRNTSSQCRKLRWKIQQARTAPRWRG